MSSVAGSFRAFLMAVQRVEQRLRKVTTALDEAGIRYAVIGGSAVAAWVAQADPSATRTTKDVDLLVNRADLDPITDVFDGLAFKREDLRIPTIPSHIPAVAFQPQRRYGRED